MRCSQKLLKQNRDIYAVARHGPNSFCVLPGECATDIEIVMKGVIRAVRGRLLKNPFSLMDKVRDASEGANTWKMYHTHRNHHKRGE